MKRELLFWPDKILRTEADGVLNYNDENNEKLNQLVADMFTVMKEWKGVGLAAPQIGVNQAVLVYDCDDEVGYMINPVLLETDNGGKYKVKEGCLSFPDIFVEVERERQIQVGWNDTKGECHEKLFIGNAAHCIQHEMDHLEGKTFLDRLSKLKRDLVLGKMKKFNKKLQLLNKRMNQ